MKKIPQLDAVRGLAVLLVLLHNTNIYPSLHLRLISDNGWMGVDLFFVLSGFLITGILLDAKQSESYFKNFYARRCLRIWPLYYSALLFMFVIVPLLRPVRSASDFRGSVVAVVVVSHSSSEFSGPDSDHRRQVCWASPGPWQSRNSSTWFGRWWCDFALKPSFAESLSR